MSGRTREPRILDPATHPREYVCLIVAAEFLELDLRTLRKRIQLGKFPVEWQDEKVYKIRLADLVAYKQRRRQEGYRRAS